MTLCPYTAMQNITESNNQRKIRRREISKRYYQKNKDKARAAIKRSRQKNPQPNRDSAKRYAAKHPDLIKQKNADYRAQNREAISERMKRWREANKEKVRSSKREWSKKRALLPFTKIEKSARLALLRAVKGGAITDRRSMEMIGCTKAELKSHLESQFKPGMTWGNHGRSGWHIDHIRPICTFDLSDRAQLAAALHYTNLQPLWAKENVQKARSITTAAANNFGAWVHEPVSGLDKVA